MDWVPAHFPKDEAGLARFDGTPCYEYADRRKGEHKDWGTLVFDYGRHEVVSFLISSAVFWLEKYHIDGIRVDAVASMLYLDYSRKEGEWVPNKNGGKENLEAVAFLQKLNESIFELFPEVMMIAEESTSWPMVSKPTFCGGLGFNYKWNMGWMNDMLHYMSLDPIYRKFNHDNITFSFFYAFSENFVLPISHDEVVHGKCSLFNKMPGESGSKVCKCAHVPLLYDGASRQKAELYGNGVRPSKSNGTMSRSSIGACSAMSAMHKCSASSKDLNHFYLEHAPLWEVDFSWEGFSWISNDDYTQSVIAFRRFDKEGNELMVVCNFLPVLREKYCIGAPYPGVYEEIFSSDAVIYGGSGLSNGAEIKTQDDEPMHGMEQSICLNLAPHVRCLYPMQTKESTPQETCGKIQDGCGQQDKKDGCIQDLLRGGNQNNTPQKKEGRTTSVTAIWRTLIHGNLFTMKYEAKEESL